MSKKKPKTQQAAAGNAKAAKPTAAQTAAKSNGASALKGAAAAVPYEPGLKAWFQRNRIYFIAFFIPVILMYIAYAIFGIWPFGEESVLALDLNGQYIYYFEGLRDAIWGEQSILYSWSRSLSGEYMGVIGYYLASPFTAIVMLLPRSMILGAMLIMILCKLGAAGVTFCWYVQKSRNLKPLHALLFSTMYAMMAYAVIQLIDPMWIDGIVFLPLIMLGVEYLVDDGRKLNYIIPLALMCIAHFYIGYMVCIFTGLYFIYYLCAGTEKLKYEVYNVFQVLVRFAAATIVALMCACIMLLPVYNSLKLGKFDFSEPNWGFATNFEPLQFFAQLLVCQYDSVNVQGSPEIYCGLLTVLLLPLFYLNDQISMRKKIGLTALLGVMFASMYIHPIDMLWHGGQAPNWLPYRYSFVVSFVLLSMAVHAFEKLEGISGKTVGGSFFCIFVLIMFIASQNQNEGYQHLETMGSIWASVAIVGLYAILLNFFQRDMKKNVFPIVLLVAISGELTYNAVHSLKDIDTEVAYSKRSSYNEYIASNREVVERLYEYDDTFYRCEKTYHRTVNDSLALGLRGITHSSSVMNTKMLKFIEAMGYSCRSYYSRYNGYTPLADSILGIKYVIDKDGDVDGSYQYLYSDTIKDQQEKEQTVNVYENPNALSIGYMADADIQKIAYFGNDNPFNSQNILLSTLVGSTTIDQTSGQITDITNYYKRLEVNPEDFLLQNIRISDYGAQICYNAEGDGDHTVDMRIEAVNNQPIYMFLKTENEKKVNLWMADQWCDDPTALTNKDGTNASWVDVYFETDNYCIVNLGTYEPGQQLTLRMTITDEYTIIKDFYFYHFDYDLYQQDIVKLQEHPWELSEESTTTDLIGTITAEEGQIMMTSIPSEPGWTVWVDGEKVEWVEIADAFVGVELTPGTHTVRMRFIPNGLPLGIVLFLVGTACSVLFYLYDRKHNRVILAALRRKQAAKEAAK